MGKYEDYKISIEKNKRAIEENAKIEALMKIIKILVVQILICVCLFIIGVFIANYADKYLEFFSYVFSTYLIVSLLLSGILLIFFMLIALFQPSNSKLQLMNKLIILIMEENERSIVNISKRVNTSYNETKSTIASMFVHSMLPSGYVNSTKKMIIFNHEKTYSSKDKQIHTTTQTITTCPNCGATLKKSQNGICKYCNSDMRN